MGAYDITVSQSFNSITHWLSEATKFAANNTVLMLVGNKSDLEVAREVTIDEGENFAKEHNILFIEASAKTGENVEEAFLETAKNIDQKIQEGGIDLNAADSGVQQKPTPGAQKPVNVGNVNTNADAGGCCK